MQVEFIDSICLPVYKNLIILSDHLQPMLTGKGPFWKIRMSTLGFVCFYQKQHNNCQRAWHLDLRFLIVIVLGCEKNRVNWSNLIGEKTENEDSEKNQ